MKYLWKYAQSDKAFHFFSFGELPNAGFQSLYAVSEEDAANMVTSESYAGFRDVVHSTMLFIDCDSDEAARMVEATLNRLGLGYEKYSTGNRGFHFSIIRDCDPSNYLPALDKKWCEQNAPWADLKLYTHLHLYRRPGMIHEKTGRRKELVFTKSGGNLDFRGMHAPPVPERESAPPGEMKSVFEDRTLMALAVPHTSGKRHGTFMTMAIRLSETGQTPEFAYGWLVNVNLLGHPLPDAEIREIVDWAFFKRRGSG